MEWKDGHHLASSSAVFPSSLLLSNTDSPSSVQGDACSTGPPPTVREGLFCEGEGWESLALFHTGVTLEMSPGLALRGAAPAGDHWGWWGFLWAFLALSTLEVSHWGRFGSLFGAVRGDTSLLTTFLTSLGAAVGDAGAKGGGCTTSACTVLKGLGPFKGQVNAI
jgi:hypothetical protein